MIAAVWPLWLQGLGLALGLTFLLWLASLPLRNASIIDAFWGPGFVALALFYFLRTGAASPRKLLLLSLVALWGLRLGIYIARRNHGKGEDFRYAAMRKASGERFPWVSLGTVFWLQGALMGALSAPLLVAQVPPQPPALGGLDVAATAIFVAGFLCEAFADAQMARFKADPSRRGSVMDQGLWRFSRHPNYFGEALLQWGLCLFALGARGGWWTLFAPVVMTLLLLEVSGVALLEKTMVETKPRYRDYIARTSAFVPWPPRSSAGPRP